MRTPSKHSTEGGSAAFGKDPVLGAGMSGLYWLLVKLLRPARPRVGALGRFALEPGFYLYTGSARRFPIHRVSRHLRRSKPIRWHMDVLTTHRAVRPLGAVLITSGPEESLPLGECDLNRIAGTLTGAGTPIPRFGATDCREGCSSHLWSLPLGSTSAVPSLSDLAGFLLPHLSSSHHSLHIVESRRFITLP